MRLFERVRAWFAGLFGREEPTEESTDDGEAETAADAETEPRLDPDNVTRTRTASDDEVVDRLREIRQQEAERPDGDASEKTD